MTEIDPSIQPYAVELISGLPNFVAVREIQVELCADAGLPLTAAEPHRASSPTTFHVACDATRRPLGVASSAVGPFAELPLGQAMAARGLALPGPELLEDPVCELVSIAITRNAGVERIDGLAEAMYRSFYQRAVASRAASIAVGVEPWLLDVLQEEYGIPFQSLGPCFTAAGRTLLPAGGRVADLQAGTIRANPSFAAYLGIAPDLPGSSDVDVDLAGAEIEPDAPVLA